MNVIGEDKPARSAFMKNIGKQGGGKNPRGDMGVKPLMKRDDKRRKAVDHFQHRRTARGR